MDTYCYLIVDGEVYASGSFAELVAIKKEKAEYFEDLKKNHGIVAHIEPAGQYYRNLCEGEYE